MSSRRYKTRNAQQDEDEHDNNAPIPSEEEEPSWKHFMQNAANVTSPGLTWFFIPFFIAVVALHDLYPQHVFLAIVPWVLIQFISAVLEEDFQEGVFKFVLGTFGAVTQYLAQGIAWAFFKLFIDSWLAHLPQEHLVTLFNCTKTNTGWLDLFYSLRGLILEWTLFWPFSIAYTGIRDPLRILYDMILYYMENVGIAILKAAGNHLIADSSREYASDGVTLIWIISGLVIYFVIGVVWTHLKLYWDVRYQNLPKKYDAIVVQCYEDGGFARFIYAIKWMVMWWIIVWPFTIISTILKNPLRVIAERLYEFSQRRLAWITEKAMARRMHKND